MIWIYTAALVFGGAFVISMVFAGTGSDLDVDLELDVDVDLDLDLDMDADPSSNADAPVGGFVASLLSFRSVVFLLAFFGAAGVFMTLLDRAQIGTFLVALFLGLVAASVQAQAFSFLSRTGHSSQRLDAELDGRPARVVVPIDGDHKGRIRADVAGQPTFLVARPYMDGDAFDAGDTVVVVEMSQGVALVGALDIGTDSPTGDDTETGAN